jgi:hypothetical protein
MVIHVILLLISFSLADRDAIITVEHRTGSWIVCSLCSYEKNGSRFPGFLATVLFCDCHNGRRVQLKKYSIRFLIDDLTITVFITCKLRMLSIN